jgi:hypothetical protein
MMLPASWSPHTIFANRPDTYVALRLEALGRAFVGSGQDNSRENGRQKLRCRACPTSRSPWLENMLQYMEHHAKEMFFKATCVRLRVGFGTPQIMRRMVPGGHTVILLTLTPATPKGLSAP